MPDSPIWRRDAASLRAAYRSRESSPLDVVDALLARIESLNPAIGAIRTVTAERARAEAASLSDELASGRDRGPLHGIPVVIKELFDVGGAETTYGSPMLAGRIPSEDAAAVARLRAAGCIVLGLARSHEFGWGITTQHATFGSTLNPWALDRVPGGSSGGAAAAVSVGMVPLALGSDTGGSIRIPATYCGVAGFKPTYGTVSKRGGVALAPSLDHPGPIARTVRDLVAGITALAGYDPLDPSTLRREFPIPDLSRGLEGVRIGVCEDLHLFPLAPDHGRVFENAVTAAERSGASIVAVDFPEAEAIRPAFADIQMAEARQYHESDLGFYPSRAAEYGRDVLSRLEMAGDVSVADYVAASRRRVQIRATFASLFDEIDVLITPITAGGPSTVDRPDRAPGTGDTPFRDLVMDYTVPQDIAGLPTCAVPAGLDADRIPVGVQITAAFGNDGVALGAAGGLEAALELTDHWPAVADESD